MSVAGVTGEKRLNRGAAEWFLMLQQMKEPDPELLQEWVAWLEASEGNRRGYEIISALWHKTPTALATSGSELPDEDGYDGSVSIAEWRAAIARRPRPFLAGRRLLLLPLAACLLLCLGWLAHRLAAPVLIADGGFATGRGEARQILLADGSRIHLGADSRLLVDFSAQRREVRLETGEAYFNVARDKARPFVVRAQDGVIRAVGTAFNVRSIEDRVTVTVIEGRVMVGSERTIDLKAGEGQSVQTAIPVSIGEQISYASAPSVISIKATPVVRVDANDSTRWREGWLTYRNESLHYVIDDIQRYSHFKFTLAPDAANIRFSGAVSQDRIAEWVEALPAVAPVAVRRDADTFNISRRVQ